MNLQKGGDDRKDPKEQIKHPKPTVGVIMWQEMKFLHKKSKLNLTLTIKEKTLWKMKTCHQLRVIQLKEM